MNYPPEPWLLTGQLHATGWLVPVGRLPDPDVPGWPMVVVAGQAIVGTVRVSYTPGGVLAYEELMATVLVRRGRQIVPSVVAIWVDSDVSRVGGRSLWGVPKELARFEGDAVVAEAGPIGSARISTLGPGVPARVGFQVAQRVGGHAAVSPVRARGRLRAHRVHWQFDTDGPLGFLTGAKTIGGFTLADFTMAFGGRPASVDAALGAARQSARLWSSVA